MNIICGTAWEWQPSEGRKSEAGGGTTQGRGAHVTLARDIVTCFKFGLGIRFGNVSVNTT